VSLQRNVFRSWHAGAVACVPSERSRRCDDEDIAAAEFLSVGRPHLAGKERSAETLGASGESLRWHSPWSMMA
jgi:hypothetical protein